MKRDSLRVILLKDSMKQTAILQLFRAFERMNKILDGLYINESNLCVRLLLCCNYMVQ